MKRFWLASRGVGKDQVVDGHGQGEDSRGCARKSPDLLLCERVVLLPVLRVGEEDA